ncbi:BamA/TamA family outer membrane protein [Balnearium lithotrophicum]|uniref:BamA/TamA family outer membrane protein n=1 Tax=Balnearium lithotrophicum TaxID=223788 RepID=UPI00163DAB28|nr:BamA/TamA family outer membrane protein [Balnearium lithotrophicum]
MVSFLLLGKPVNKSDIENAKYILFLKIRSLGYSKPDISYAVKKTECGYVVLFTVKNLILYRISKIELNFNGDTSIKSEVENEIRELTGETPEYSFLSKLKEKIVDLMLNRGYYNGRVNLRLEPIEGNRGLVKLLISVQTGKKYIVKFDGNRHFSEKKLSKLLTFRRAAAVDPFEIENSVRNIKTFYQNNGFPFVSVKATTRAVDGEEIVEFKIYEGPEVFFKEFKFLGIDENLVDRRKIEKLTGKPFSQRDVNSIKLELVSNLKRKGYLSAKVNVSVSKEGTVKFIVEKGPIYRIVSLKVEGDTLNCFKEIKLPTVYSDRVLEDILNKISDCYGFKGFPDVKVIYRKKELRRRGNEVLMGVFIRIFPGKEYRFGYVIFQGLKRTKLKYIKNLVLIKPSQIYSKEKVTKQYSLLMDSRLFSKIDIKEFKTDSAISEIITLQEGSLLKTKGFVGYGTDSGIVTNGFLSSTSPFGYGLKYFLFGKYRQKEGYDAVFKVMKPQFPFRKWDTSYSIVKKEQIYESFKTDKTTYNFELLRRKSKSFFQTFRIEVSRERISNTSIRAKSSFLKRSFVYSQTYDRRDNKSNPKRGFLSFLNLSLSGFLLGGDTDYVMAEEKFLYLFPIGEEIFVVRLNGGIINSIGGKPVPVQDRFFLGGAESIRGYKYGTVSPTDEKGNYIGGKAYGLFSLEVRRSLTKNLEGALFYDSGRVFREPSRFKLSNWYSSVGFGIRYLTPVGPLRFDYGYKLKKVPGQGRGRFHISFGFPF